MAEKLGGKKGFRNYRRGGDHFDHLPPSHPSISTNCYRIRETPATSGMVSRAEANRDFKHLVKLVSVCLVSRISNIGRFYFKEFVKSGIRVVLFFDEVV